MREGLRLEKKLLNNEALIKIASEISVLYEISSLSFSNSVEKILSEVFEKAARLFGASRIAVFFERGGKRKLLKTKGFPKNESVVKNLLADGDDRQILFSFDAGNGKWIMYFIHTFPLEAAEKRLYQVFLSTVQKAIRSALFHEEKKRAEEKLRESEEKYRCIVENSLAGVYIIQDGVFKFVNQRFCDIFGYRYEEIVERLGPLDLTFEEDKGLVVESIRKRLEGELKFIEYSFRGLRRDGTPFPVKALGSAAVYNGRPAIIGTLIDLSKEKELERQLVHSQKMDAIGKLTGNIAHDMNNILSAIMSYCELMKLKFKDGQESLKEVASNVESIMEIAEKGARLVNQLLAFSRKQPAQPKVINVNVIIDQLRDMMSRLAGENVRLVVNLSKDLGNVKIDPIQLEQVLINLLVNARDAMPRGGVLEITTENVEVGAGYQEDQFRMSEGRYVLLTFSDTGVGIPEEVQDKIFEPFFTTKERGKGTGLGLSTVYGIVKQNGGYVAVSSRVGEGTTFKIYLPIVEESPSLASQREGDEIEGVREKCAILYVEDNDDVRRAVSELLRKNGYRVYDARDAEEGYEKFLNLRDEIEIVLTDVILPKMSGKELVRRIREHNKDVGVIFASGYSEDSISKFGLLYQGINFLPKPFTIRELIRKIEEVRSK